LVRLQVSIRGPEPMFLCMPPLPRWAMQQHVASERKIPIQEQR
jgi:hypothetical protein